MRRRRGRPSRFAVVPLFKLFGARGARAAAVARARSCARRRPLRYAAVAVGARRCARAFSVAHPPLPLVLLPLVGLRREA